jgi:hypothetical protein
MRCASVARRTAEHATGVADFGTDCLRQQQCAHVKKYGDRAAEQVPKGRFYRTPGCDAGGGGIGEREL